MIQHGDCIEVMAAMEPESVDAIVTDPPYGLEFMGKEWDKLGATIEPQAGDTKGWHNGSGVFVPGASGPFGGSGRRVRYGATATSMQAFHARWAEAAYRVAKPSAYLLAFGGTRTVHRMTVALEDAGWIIRDMLVWAYASGFPKSKASLKPAWEPIVMARKPGPLRMLAIDECRIPGTKPLMEAIDSDKRDKRILHTRSATGTGEMSTEGRWPANVILTDPIFDGGVEGVVGGGEAASGGNINGRPVTGYGGHWADSREFDGYSDSGTYSRFFLIPKADRADREPVMGGLPLQRAGTMEDDAYGWEREVERGRQPRNAMRQNVHPTVKPTELMRHLVRLVTPAGGVVLDPFLGSGTTGLACELEGFPWIGIEKEAEYVAIAEARLNGTQRGLGLSA